jgi:flavin-dependent dehydrogenase
MYDVIIVGGRCAGSPLARLLALSGAKVLLVDRTTFPSDIPHGHFIHRHGPRRLQAWNLLDRLAAVSPPITEQLVDLGDYPLVSRNLALDGVALGYGPRRSLLDKLLVDAAVDAGAELREGFNVEEFVFEGGRLTGIRGRSAGGDVIQERAAITVGADGRNSRLASAVKAEVYEAAPTLLCYYFSYWSGVESCAFELYQRTNERRVIFSFRTSEDLFAVFVGCPIDELHEVRTDIKRHFMRALDLAPDFSERIRAARQEERFYGASDLPNFYRKPHGPGWALVGDAGCHKDPYMALGISDALRDVELLAGAIGDGLGGRRVLHEALADYERQRNEASAFEYQQNLSAARFEPLPAEMWRIREAVRTNPAQATRLAMVRSGMLERQAFFNPENLQQLLGSPT